MATTCVDCSSPRRAPSSAPGVIPREIECYRRQTPTRLFPHAADLPILQFRAMQAAGPGRDRTFAHLFHLIRRVRLEVLSEAHVVVQLADGAAADGGAMDGQAQRILQALFGIQDPK